MLRKDAKSVPPMQDSNEVASGSDRQVKYMSYNQFKMDEDGLFLRCKDGREWLSAEFDDLAWRETLVAGDGLIGSSSSMMTVLRTWSQSQPPSFMATLQR